MLFFIVFVACACVCFYAMYNFACAAHVV